MGKVNRGETQASMNEDLTTINKRISTNKDLLLDQLKKIPIVQIACEKVGVGRATYYRWRKQDSEFARQADASIRQGVLLINDLAESQLLNQIKNGHMTAIIYWLKHRHKDYSTRVELSGSLEHKNAPLPKDYKDLILKALQIASPNKEKQE